MTEEQKKMVQAVILTLTTGFCPGDVPLSDQALQMMYQLALGVAPKLVAESNV
jgi:hypothetical protein